MQEVLPVLLAYRRATAPERSALEHLGPSASGQDLEQVRDIIRRRGGVVGTRRAIARSLSGAQRALPESPLSDEQVRQVETFLAMIGDETR